jgi:hypothetical protein
MKKDELIDLYLSARMMHSQAAYFRRRFIQTEDFELAMQNQFDMHFWQEELTDVCLKLHKKGWYGDAVEEAWV